MWWVSYNRAYDNYAPAQSSVTYKQLRPEGWESVALHQVYYQWHQVNSKKWRCHSDSFLSAQSLLSESPDIRSSSYALLHYTKVNNTLRSTAYAWRRNLLSKRVLGVRWLTK